MDGKQQLHILDSGTEVKDPCAAALLEERKEERWEAMEELPSGQNDASRRLPSAFLGPGPF